jgi:DNA invertase Pin-like site-specific DNA recombinase
MPRYTPFFRVSTLFTLIYLTFPKVRVYYAVMTPKQAIKQFGTVTEMARILGISRQIIYNWLRKGKMPEQWQALVQAKLK